MSKKNDERRIEAVDLFCGVGGLTKGLEKSGVDVALGVDLDPACEYPYEANNNAHFLLKSVEKLKKGDIEKYFSKSGLTLLAGCAPCQPFSKYSKGKATPNDHRWSLLTHFQRLVYRVMPDFVTMENVPGLEKQEIFKKFAKGLERKGYFVSYSVVNCADYGIPQQRQRLVLLGSLHGEIKLIKPTHKPVNYRTVRDAIGKLPRISHGSSYKNDPLHKSPTLSDLNLKRIKASKPGGTWRDWDQKLVAKCHKKKSGQTFPGVYGRMEWDKPSPTITTQFYGFGNGRFGHPRQNRALSLREGAIIQTFPKSYKFVQKGNPVEFTLLGRLIGNAVPVRLGEVIGKSFKRHATEMGLH